MPRCCRKPCFSTRRNASDKLTALTQNPANDYGPSYLPDGQKIAYISARTDKCGLYVLDGEKPPALVFPLQATLAAPAWSPDNRRVTFQAAEKGASVLYLADTRKNTAEVISQANEDVFPFRTQFVSGREFFYTADVKNGAVHSLDELLKRP